MIRSRIRLSVEARQSSGSLAVFRCVDMWGQASGPGAVVLDGGSGVRQLVESARRCMCRRLDSASLTGRLRRERNGADLLIIEIECGGERVVGTFDTSGALFWHYRLRT